MVDLEGAFVFGVTFARDDSGEIHVNTHMMKNNIPDEFVLMKLRAQLKSMERDYFKSFDEDSY